MYKRLLKIEELIKETSYFLFGPRSTGKTALIRERFKNAKVFDLLDSDLFDELVRRPKALSEKLNSKDKYVVIDEIQKIPALLDEVHRLIESKDIKFLLTGSSARKLRSKGSNLLAGRAREAQLFTLTYHEITDFDLLKYLNYGGLPKVYLSKQPLEDLKAYVRTYLNEEIKAEALVRNYERYIRFLEGMALCNAQEMNYQSISRDSGVPVRTLEGYLEVLKDTLIGFELVPYQKTLKRKSSTKSKFYFFDTGVSNFLAEKYHLSEGSTDLGVSFEQFLILEVRAYLSYSRSLYKMSYWRSKQHEVDLIIGDELAVEFKFSKKIKDSFFDGLKVLRQESKIKRYLCVSRDHAKGTTEGGIEYCSYEEFLKKLWASEYFN